MTGAHRVRFRAPEHRARVARGGRVDLVGDFPDFRVPHTLANDDEGVPSVTLALGPGVYRAKLLLDLVEWVLPTTTPETDTSIDMTTETADGYTNAVVVVGGAPLPLVFAPDARHVARDAEGALLLRAEHAARDAIGDPLIEVLLDDGARSHGAFTEHARTGDRVLLSARVALPRGSQGTFTVDGAGPWPLPPCPREELARRRAPVLLFVLVDRWHRGRESAPDPRARDRAHPSYPSVFYGGDLGGIRQALPYFADLGVDGLVLSPLHPAPTPHRYDATDLLATDPLLGGERALRALLDDAHARGLQIVVDLAVTHVNHQHAHFQSLLAEQERSPFVEWFRVKQFPVRRRDPSTYAHYWDCIDLPWLALDRAPAAAHALEVARRYSTLGVDGLRLDAMLDAPVSFWRALTERLRAEFPSLFLLGEVVGDHPTPFLDDGSGPSGAHAVTDGRLRERLLALITTSRVDAASALAAFADALVVDAHRFGVFSAHTRAVFLDTHDTARFLSRVDDEAAVALAAHTIAFLPHPWLLTYGTECGLAARAGEPPLDGAWPERLAMPPLDDARRHALFAPIAQAIALRHALDDDEAGAPDVELHAGHLTITRVGRSTRFTLRLTTKGHAEPALGQGSVRARVEAGDLALVVVEEPREE